jgi:SPP1 gp7 family putative phage head morphogenesis protein
MQRYSLAKLASKPKGAKVELPAVEVRLSAEKQYYAALRSMLTQIAAMMRESTIPLYESEQARKRAERAYTADAGREWFANVHAMMSHLQRVASDTVNRILNLEAERHTEAFMATAKRALGINLQAVVTQEDLTEYLQTAVARNTSLIQSLGDDIVKRVEQTVYANSVAGNSVTTLRKALQEQFGITDRRAKLIARDQTSKFNSDLNKIRQQQAGVTSYVWMTSHDERVRALHRKLDGKTYKWGEATGAEQGLPPGQPVNCRCLARGIVEF